WIWGVAFAIDLGTPWLAVPHSVKVPPDAAHLPERFGLFTLILLGESVVAVMQGMESQPRGLVSGGGDVGVPGHGHRVRDLVVVLRWRVRRVGAAGANQAR